MYHTAFQYMPYISGVPCSEYHVSIIRNTLAQFLTSSLDFGRGDPNDVCPKTNTEPLEYVHHYVIVHAVSPPTTT